MKTLLILSILITSVVFAQQHQSEEDLVASTVQKAMDACYNSGNLEDFENIFHKDFILMVKPHSFDGMRKITKEDYRNTIKKRKEAKLYPNAMGAKVTVKFRKIDISGHSAIVLQDFYKGEFHTCYDNISLYKYSTGWKIVCWTTFTNPDENAKARAKYLNK